MMRALSCPILCVLAICLGAQANSHPDSLWEFDSNTPASVNATTLKALLDPQQLGLASQQVVSVFNSTTAFGVVFAPSNQALSQLLGNLGLTVSDLREDSVDVLLQDHIIGNGSLPVQGQSETKTFLSMGGHSLSITFDAQGNITTVSPDQPAPSSFAQSSSVLGSFGPIADGNAILYYIDAVVLPLQTYLNFVRGREVAPDKRWKRVAQDEDIDQVERVVEASGLERTVFADGSELTMFMPTDAALEQLDLRLTQDIREAAAADEDTQLDGVRGLVETLANSRPLAKDLLNSYIVMDDQLLGNDTLTDGVFYRTRNVNIELRRTGNQITIRETSAGGRRRKLLSSHNIGRIPSLQTATEFDGKSIFPLQDAPVTSTQEDLIRAAMQSAASRLGPSILGVVYGSFLVAIMLAAMYL